MAQKKPAGKPIKITLTEQQIADIIQRAAKTRRNVRVESLEDRIAPSRIGLPIFGGAEGDIEKPDDYVAPDGGHIDPLNDPHQDPLSLNGGNPTDISASGDGFGDPLNPVLPPNPEDFNPETDPFLPNPPTSGDPIVDNPDPGPFVDPDAPILPEQLEGDGPVEPEALEGEQNAVFNDPLHVQGEAPEGAPSPEELEEHRLNILRQLRASSD